VSSLMDTWLLLANVESNGERTRTIQVLKSRGMAHSNRVREFVMADDGIRLLDVCIADGRILTGSARVAHLQRLAAEAERPAKSGRGARSAS